MPYAELPGRKAHYVRRGEGEPFLAIMGMSGSHVSWGEPFLEALARDFDVIAFDNRGVGLSDWVSEPFATADLAADAAGLLDALEVESAHVLGVSMGGMIAQELVLTHPERVRTLSLGCTYCGGPNGRITSPAVAQRLAAGMMSGDRELALRTAYEVNLSAGYRADESRYAAFREMATQYPAAVEVILLQAQAAQAHDAAARLAAIATPTLVIHGTEDEMLECSNGELIASLIPGARLERLEGVGHMFWWEQPERSAALVREHARTAAGTAGEAAARQ
ncbi:MAG: alpha/beta hydrolase [Actinomycetota bacterium]|nr:alpha/beta hydrolase [Actinomycetota bacterium]